jgi:hypothetical protein
MPALQIRGANLPAVEQLAGYDEHSVCGFRAAASVGSGGLTFSVQRLLQLFPCLVVKIFVFVRWLASLLPELVRSPDNIDFLGCSHAIPLYPLLAQ